MELPLRKSSGAVGAAESEVWPEFNALNIPLELLEKINVGYASVFEKDRFLCFKKGVLISETVKKNKKPNS